MSSAAVTVTLTPSQRAWLELIAHGWLAPLDGFMSRAEQESVERAGRLPGPSGRFRARSRSRFRGRLCRRTCRALAGVTAPARTRRWR